MKIIYASCIAAMAGLFFPAIQADAGINKPVVAINSYHGNGNNIENGNGNSHTVPEPSTAILLAAGITGLAARKLVKRSRA